MPGAPCHSGCMVRAGVPATRNHRSRAGVIQHCTSSEAENPERVRPCAVPSASSAFGKPGPALPLGRSAAHASPRRPTLLTTKPFLSRPCCLFHLLDLDKSLGPRGSPLPGESLSTDLAGLHSGGRCTGSHHCPQRWSRGCAGCAPSAAPVARGSQARGTLLGLPCGLGGSRPLPLHLCGALAPACGLSGVTTSLLG